MCRKTNLSKLRVRERVKSTDHVNFLEGIPWTRAFVLYAKDTKWLPKRKSKDKLVQKTQQVKGESRGLEATDGQVAGETGWGSGFPREKLASTSERPGVRPFPTTAPLPLPYRTFPLLPHLSAVVAAATPDNVALPTRTSGKIDSHKATLSCRKMTIDIS